MQLDEPQCMEAGRVYAVIPVFNRISETLGCIECLKQQSHADICIILADGGSTDGTPEMVRAKHPDVVVLSGRKTLWWGGATRLGIDWALADGARDSDFILMVNNDTRFESDLVSCLIETSRKYHAAVGGVVVNADDPDEVIDGGINLDWCDYRFHTVKELPAGGYVKLDSDVLPGRGTLVPVWAILKAGSVDDERFPHYLADYEFTHRLKKSGGVCLAVDYRARIRTRVEPSRTAGAEKSTGGTLRNMFNRRSKSNFMDHLRFVHKHAPPSYRLNLLFRQLLSRIPRPHLRSRLRRASMQEPGKASEGVDNMRTSTIYRRLSILFFKVYLVSEEDCRRFSLCPHALCERGILLPSPYAGYFVFAVPLRYLRHEAPEVVPLYWRAWRPDRKIMNYRAVHGGENSSQTMKRWNHEKSQGRKMKL